MKQFIWPKFFFWNEETQFSFPLCRRNLLGICAAILKSRFYSQLLEPLSQTWCLCIFMYRQMGCRKLVCWIYHSICTHPIHPRISLSEKSSFQNKSLVHKLTSLTPWENSKDQLALPCSFQVEKSIVDGPSDLISWHTYEKITFLTCDLK